VSVLWRRLGIVSAIRQRRDNSSSSAMPPLIRSSGVGNSLSPSLGATGGDNWIIATPHIQRYTYPSYPLRSNAELLSRTQYGVLPGTTPRSLSTLTVSVSTLTGARSNDVLPVLGCQQSHKRHPETPAFAEQETFLEINCNGQHLQAYISAKIGKGFFYSLDWK